MIASVEEAVATLKAGRMIILVDDEDRENEGDLVVAASEVTAEHIAFMTRHARGLVCLALAPEICDSLGLEPMAARNTAPLGTAFTVSIDARDHAATGITAESRAATIRLAVRPDARRGDFVSPGHVFPLRAVPGGVLVRTGQTEGSVDLARLAGLTPAGVICEILKDDGTMMRLPHLLEFGADHGIPVATVADVVAWRLRYERLIEEVAVADLPTDFGPFSVHAFRTTLDNRAHLALVLGTIPGDEPILVRVHRAGFPGDTFPFSEGRGRQDVEGALEAISRAGRGVFLYLNREESGGDLLAGLARIGCAVDASSALAAAVSLESRLHFRDFGIGAQILRTLGARRLRVLTDNPKRYIGLAGFGLVVEEFVAMGG